MRTLAAAASAYLIVSILLYPVPVFNILHAESMLVVALASFFISGVAALNRLKEGTGLGRVLLEQELLLLIPLGLLSLTMLWVPNCAYAQGLLFFLLFPVVTVVLAVSVAFYLTEGRFRWRRSLLCLAGLVVMVAGTAYDLLLHPQLYTYNHIFGGFLGPIYDEELAMRPGLFVFRVLTLLWALIFFSVGMRAATGDPIWSARAGLLALPVGLVYAFSAQLGINSPSWYIQSQLGGHVQTDQFDIYYDPQALSESAIRWMADTHEFRYMQIATELDVEVTGRIQSYLYPDPDTKAALTGSRETSVAPVWLGEPHIHMLQDRFEQSFAHELVHVFSREFGLPLIRTSVSIGLVEGLAVALEPPSGRPGPHEIVAASISHRSDPVVHLDDLSAAVAANLGVRGFWGGRGAVSYTTMGSFVRFLLDRYGPEKLLSVYRLANFRDVYGKSVAELAREWEDFVLAYPVGEEAVAVMAARFSVPSLFEVTCPHFVPRHVRMTRAADRSIQQNDTSAANARLAQALELRPDYPPALSLWSRIRLADRQPAAVISRLEETWNRTEATFPLYLQMHMADAFILAGSAETGSQLLLETARALPPWAIEERLFVTCRAALQGDAIKILTAAIEPYYKGLGLSAIIPRDECLEVYTGKAYADAELFDAAAYHTSLAITGFFEAEKRAHVAYLLALHRLRSNDTVGASVAALSAAELFEREGLGSRAALVHDLLHRIGFVRMPRPNPMDPE